MSYVDPDPRVSSRADFGRAGLCVCLDCVHASELGSSRCGRCLRPAGPGICPCSCAGCQPMGVPIRGDLPAPTFCSLEQCGWRPRSSSFSMRLPRVRCARSLEQCSWRPRPLLWVRPREGFRADGPVFWRLLRGIPHSCSGVRPWEPYMPGLPLIPSTFWYLRTCS